MSFDELHPRIQDHAKKFLSYFGNACDAERVCRPFLDEFDGGVSDADGVGSAVDLQLMIYPSITLRFWVKDLRTDIAPILRKLAERFGVRHASSHPPLQTQSGLFYNLSFINPHHVKEATDGKLTSCQLAAYFRPSGESECRLVTTKKTIETSEYHYECGGQPVKTEEPSA